MSPARLRRSALGLALLLAAARIDADSNPKLRVEIRGLGGAMGGVLQNQTLKGSDLKQNVLSLLRIEDARREKNLTERRIRQLHARAPDEIRRALQPFGFYRPTIDASLEREGDTWVARYDIDPGAPIRLQSVDVAVAGEGATDWGFRTAVGDFPLRTGDVLNHAAYESGKAAFEAMAGEIGYLDGKFETAQIQIDVEAYTSRIVLHYDTGPRYLFGPVAFRQDFLNPKLLRGYVNWEEGEPLNQNKLLALQTALSDSPYFRRVEVITDRARTSGLEVPIEVDLEASKKRRYQFGLGYGTDTGPRGTVRAEYRRINRHGDHAEAEIRVSAIEQSIVAKYLIPGAYPRTDVLTFTTGYGHLNPATSDTKAALAGADYSFALGRWRQGFSLTFTRERFTVGIDDGVSHLLAPGSSTSLVVADDRIDARNGYRLLLKLSGAKDGFLSNATYAQTVASAKRIVSFAGSNRLIGRVDVGATATSDFRRLPPRVRFFAGGDVSVRGYKFQSLGELDERGHVIGGKYLEVASLEAEHRFLPKWGAAVFFDAGNAANRLTSSLKKGVGAGIRWISPIGPVRVDGAYALDPPRGVRLHVNIGPDL
jgi:translocation and assembly module TamA